jgi:hypothetical protein
MGLTKVEASWDIGDQKIGKAKVYDIRDWKTPKSEFYFYVVNEEAIRPKGCKEQKNPMGLFYQRF